MRLFAALVATLLLGTMAAGATKPEAVLRKEVGNDFLKKRDYAKARDQYLAALRIDPTYEDAHYNLGIVYFFRLQDYPRALYHLTTYARDVKDAPDMGQVKSLVFQALEKIEDADRDAYARALAEGTASALRGYLERRPDSAYAGDAKEKIRRIESYDEALRSYVAAAEEAFKAAAATSSIPALKEFIKNYEGTPRVAEAEGLIDSLEKAEVREKAEAEARAREPAPSRAAPAAVPPPAAEPTPPPAAVPPPAAEPTPPPAVVPSPAAEPTPPPAAVPSPAAEPTPPPAVVPPPAAEPTPPPAVVPPPAAEPTPPPAAEPTPTTPAAPATGPSAAAALPNGPPAPPPAPAAAPAPPPELSPSVPLPPEEQLRVDWKKATSADTTEAYEEFLRLYPGGEEAEAAKKRLLELNGDGDEIRLEREKKKALDKYRKMIQGK